MADNFVVKDATGNLVTMKSKDVGSGIESPQVIPSDPSGNPYSTSNPAPAQSVAGAAGGATPFHLLSAASTNATNIKASAATLYYAKAVNTTATTYYLKFYDKATTPAPASDASLVKLTLPVPANGQVDLNAAVGAAFANGLGIALTAGQADNDNTNAATGVTINLLYK